MRISDWSSDKCSTDLCLVFGIQHAMAFAIQAVAAQLGEAGYAPEVGTHAPVALQHFLRSHDFAQDRARAHKLDARLLGIAHGLALVHPANNPFFVALGQAGLWVVFVHDRDVLITVLLIDWNGVV